MNNYASLGKGRWPPSQARLVDQVCDRFEAAWKTTGPEGPQPRIEDYLGDAPEQECSALATELIPLEVYYRRLRGEAPQLGEYRERFPELDPDLLAAALADRAAAEPHQAPTPLMPQANAAPQKRLRCPRCHHSMPMTGEPPCEVLCSACGSSFRVDNPGAPSLVGALRASGRFQLLEQVGFGTFGAVWRAHDSKLDRIVAVKVPHASLLLAPVHLERFNREARAAAQLRHPGIVTVHEVATLDGLPVIVSDFIEGTPLRDVLSERRLSFREAAALVAEVAEAVDYAHTMGLVHRDLKPANILLERSGVRGQGSGTAKDLGSSSLNPVPCSLTPRLVDFGLALREEAEVTMTLEGQIIGTPAYMSPEQAAGKGHQVDRRSDVYSLGVILYELLTGELPFRGSKAMLLQQVLVEEPRPPRKTNDKVPRDLETICLKCLAKSPARRYATARELAEDLRRWLKGEPIQARPVSRWERGWRWARRRPAVAALILVSVVAVLALGGIVTGSFFYTRLQNEMERAETYQYFYHIAVAHAGWREGDLACMEPLLDACPSQRRNWEWRYLKRLCHQDLLTLQGHTNVVRCVAFSPDGKRLASASYDRTVKIWDAETGELLRTLKGHDDQIWALAYSRDGTLIASGSWDGHIKVWETETGKEVPTWNKGHDGKRHDSEIYAVALSPDGERLASAGGDYTVRVWDVKTGQRIFDPLKGHTNLVTGVAYRPDGKRLASASTDNRIKIWDAATGQEDPTIKVKGHDAPVACVAYSPDGKQLASCSWDGTVMVQDAANGERIYHWKSHTGPVMNVAFSPDGKWLASASGDGTIKVWNVQQGQEAFTHKGHTRGIMGVAFSPDGKQLASASSDETVKLWDPFASQEARTIKGHGAVRCVAISQDGAWLALGSREGRITVLNAKTFQKDRESESHTLEVRSVAFSPDGKRIASASQDRTVKVWDRTTGLDVFSLPEQTDPVRSVAFSPDGKQLATAGDDRTVKIWDANTGKWLFTLKGHTAYVRSLAFSPDGKWLASGSFDRTVKIWDMTTWQLSLSLEEHADAVWDVAFDREGKWIASASRDMTIKIWDAKTGLQLRTLEGHNLQVLKVAFSPDGTRLVSTSQDHTIKLWDTTTGQKALMLMGHAGPVWSVVFSSPDGNRLISVSDDETLKIWDATPSTPSP